MKQAFVQCYVWLHASLTFVESIEINPEDYGCKLTEGDMIVPKINSTDVIPDDLPVPCNCLKCAGKKISCLPLPCKTNKQLEIL